MDYYQYSSPFSGFKDAASHGDAYSATTTGPYTMQRGDSGRSDLSLYEEDFATADTDFATSPVYDTMSTAWPASAHYSSDYNQDVKPEPESFDSQSPSETINLFDTLADGSSGAEAAAWKVTRDATDWLNSGGYYHFNPYYITTDRIEQQLLALGSSDAQSEEQAVEDVLYGQLWLYQNSEDITTQILHEAACQLQLRVGKGLIPTTMQSICCSSIEWVFEQLKKDLYSTTSPSATSSMSAKPSSTGKGPHICYEPECGGKSFNRSADLDRHMKNIHTKEEEKKGYKCDYKKCPRHNKHFFRQDHFRDHLRDQHKEDLPRRSTKPDAKFWASRSLRPFENGWWRCNRCLLRRVDIATHAFLCPGCGQTCEAERQEYRERFALGG